MPIQNGAVYPRSRTAVKTGACRLNTTVMISISSANFGFLKQSPKPE
jgi:hypothetical protein